MVVSNHNRADNPANSIDSASARSTNSTPGTMVNAASYSRPCATPQIITPTRAIFRMAATRLMVVLSRNPFSGNANRITEANSEVISAKIGMSTLRVIGQPPQTAGTSLTTRVRPPGQGPATTTPESSVSPPGFWKDDRTGQYLSIQ